MWPLFWAAVALMIIGVGCLAFVFYKEGLLDEVRLPRWMGWRLDAWLADRRVHLRRLLREAVDGYQPAPVLHVIMARIRRGRR